MPSGIFHRNFGGLLGGGCGGFGPCGFDQKSGCVVSAIRAGCISGDYDLDRVWQSSGW
jgi:hypothetical protein